MIQLEVSYRLINFCIFIIPLVIFIYADSSKATEIIFESLKVSSEERNATIYSNQLLRYFSYLTTLLQNTFYFFRKMVTGEPKPSGVSIAIESWKYKGRNVSVFAFQGDRKYMQDRFYIDENFGDTGVSVYAIFDGHTHDFAAKYVVENLMKSLKQTIKELKQRTGQIKFKKYMLKNGTINYEILLRDKILATEEALLKTIRKNINNSIPQRYKNWVESNDFNYIELLNDKKIDKDVRNKIRIAISAHDSGTTALIALIDNGKLFVANVGDSRGVMINKKGIIQNLSEDHKPEEQKEKERIRKAGGIIVSNDFTTISRIDGFSLSRTIGDLKIKLLKHIIANPDIFEYDLINFKPKFIILATDGLWDKFSSKEALAYINKRLDTELFGAKDIALKAYEKGSQDNVTVLIVKTG